MALQYGNTLRLHHMDFPSAIHESPRESWTRRDSVSSTGSNGSQLESPPPVATHSFANSPMEIEKDIKNTEAYTVDSNHQATIHSFHPEKSVNGGSQGTITHHTLTARVTTPSTHNNQFSNISVNIECDVLESFTEFATFLELQNPICPAELLDTPEKLMNVLVWKHFRAH